MSNNVMVLGSDNNTPSAPALTADLIAMSQQGIVFRVNLYNTNAAARYFMFFDTAIAVANATVPLFQVKLAADSGIQLEFGNGGLKMGVGLYISNSTTTAALTKGAADALIFVSYRKSS